MERLKGLISDTSSAANVTQTDNNVTQTLADEEMYFKLREVECMHLFFSI